MLDEQMIVNIRETGIAQGAATAGERTTMLRDELGLRTAERAQYVLLASCFLPFQVPEPLRALGKLLARFQVDYSLLHQEYCCGNPLFQQALIDKSEDEIQAAQGLAGEFLGYNLQQVRELGAGTIITFCAGCDMIYRRLGEAVPQEVVWYPTLLDRIFRGGRLEMEADYYPGCHRLYRRLSPIPVDLESPLRVLDRIEGLRLHHLPASACCARAEQLESLAGAVQHKTVITICGACTTRLQEYLKTRGDYRVIMLPELIWVSIDDRTN